MAHILFWSATEPPSRWVDVLRAQLPGENFYWSAAEADREKVEVILADIPPQGSLARFRNLKLIQSLWMGVDHWVNAVDLPRNVPIARMIDPHMLVAMSETVAAHALHAHLRHDDYRRQQSAGEWREYYCPAASERKVGVMGLGELGSASARTLASLGFRVNGYSRTPKTIEGVRVFAGRESLVDFLTACEIVVCLLPSTVETRGLADAKFFAAMREDSVFINVARGPIVVEQDLLAALDGGHLRHAVLDVFEPEPLPRAHVFWSHPRITVTPHCASLADPNSAAKFIAENLRRLKSGEPLRGLIDLRRGY